MDNEKLQRGVMLLARAGSDPELLGVALLALHATMEDALHAALERSATLGSVERERLAHGEVDMHTLVTLAERHIGLSRAEGNTILEAERQRNRFAVGEPFSGSADRLLRYARLIAAFCGEPALLDVALTDARRDRASTAPHAAPVPQPTGWRPSGWALAQLVSFMVIVGVLGGGAWWLYRQLDVPRLVGAFGTPPTAVTRATLTVPVATPQQRAHIVRIGAGPGWLHDAPDFGSATLPTPLHDGMIVTLLDQQQTSVDGTIWLRVAVNGYDGWCPAQNLEPESASRG